MDGVVMLQENIDLNVLAVKMTVYVYGHTDDSRFRSVSAEEVMKNVEGITAANIRRVADTALGAGLVEMVYRNSEPYYYCSEKGEEFVRSSAHAKD